MKKLAIIMLTMLMLTSCSIAIGTQQCGTGDKKANTDVVTERDVQVPVDVRGLPGVGL